MESLELLTQIDVDWYNFCQILGYVGPRSFKMKTTVQCISCAVESLELPRQVSHSVYVQGQIMDFPEAWMGVWRAAGGLSGDE